MKLIYKEKPKSGYDLALEALQREFPKRKFKIITQTDNAWGTEQIGISERISFWNWRELDLYAMGFFKRPHVEPSPYPRCTP